MARVSEFYVGTSGWSYGHWRSRFYPKTLPSSHWFEHYSRFFDTVELNATFYRLPEKSTFEAWRADAPADFVFAVKGSRYLTHMKRLLAPQEPLERLVTRAQGLGDRLGPLLYQLPPTMQRNDERLAAFLRALPAGYQHVVEFRNKTWYAAPIFALLREHGVGFCVHDWKACPAPLELTAAFSYIRLHGTIAPFAGSYSRSRLLRWRDRIYELRDRGASTIYAYFNNDSWAFAVHNALALKEMLGQVKMLSASG
ncbi:MAG: DUF72 domain-containing protein [Candidatus Eremiobacteraeota bacterium]|nr:DUF72 domain-containing protein [Candidatus Eremiobacteraeota bacterium]